jgi:hypothetical protein
MPQATFLTSTSAVVGNQVTPLAGWAYEFLPWPARVKVLMTCDKPLGTVQVYSGSESIVDPSPVSVGTINILPADLNTHAIIFDAPAGDRLRLVCTGGTATTQFQTVILVTPLA